MIAVDQRFQRQHRQRRDRAAHREQRRAQDVESCRSRRRRPARSPTRSPLADLDRPAPRGARASAPSSRASRGSGAPDRGSPPPRRPDPPAGRGPLRRCRPRESSASNAHVAAATHLDRNRLARRAAPVSAVERARAKSREQRLEAPPRHRVVEQVEQRLREIARRRVVLQELRARRSVRRARWAARPTAAASLRRTIHAGQARDAIEDHVRAARERRFERRGAGGDERRRPRRAARRRRGRRAASAAAQRARAGSAPRRTARASARVTSGTRNCASGRASWISAAARRAPVLACISISDSRAARAAARTPASPRRA